MRNSDYNNRVMRLPNSKALRKSVKGVLVGSELAMTDAKMFSAAPMPRTGEMTIASFYPGMPASVYISSAGRGLQPPFTSAPEWPATQIQASYSDTSPLASGWNNVLTLG